VVEQIQTGNRYWRKNWIYRWLQAAVLLPQFLEAAGVREADMLLAVTEFDELNMVSCLLGKQYGVKTTVAGCAIPNIWKSKLFL
jgi:Trk K+ transport system NAD-binding subunit